MLANDISVEAESLDDFAEMEIQLMKLLGNKKNNNKEYWIDRQQQYILYYLSQIETAINVNSDSENKQQSLLSQQVSWPRQIILYLFLV